MLGCARAAGVYGVEIHFSVIGDITANHRALQKMNIVERVGYPGCIK